MVRRRFLQLLGLGAAAAPAAPAALASMTAPSVTSTVATGIAAQIADGVTGGVVESVAGEKAADILKMVNGVRRSLKEWDDGSREYEERIDNDDGHSYRDLHYSVTCLKSVSNVYKEHMHMRLVIQKRKRSSKYYLNRRLEELLLGIDPDSEYRFRNY